MAAEEMKKKDAGASAGGKKKKEKAGSGGAEGRKVRFGLRMKFSLAIITLVSVVIVIMTLYFIRTESALLKAEIIKFAEREIEHLTNTAQESISAKDELALIAAVRNVQKITAIRYVYIFDPNGRIIQNFDPEKNGTDMEDDEITRRAKEYAETERPLMLDFPDPVEKGGGNIRFFEARAPYAV
jgi:hypothetical protein